MLNFLPANSPSYVAWKGSQSQTIVIAIAHQMVSRILSNAGIGSNLSLSPHFAIRDKTIIQLAKTCNEQVGTNAPGAKLFTESLCIALVTHIYRTYGERVAVELVKGGLTPLDAQRVITYIEQNMHENIGLQHLASTVQLSTHYFTEAFRKTVGMPPYRFLITRRIERAKDLLLQSKLEPRTIAADVGFTSYTQFITNFRKIVGKTPGRFRREAS